MLSSADHRAVLAEYLKAARVAAAEAEHRGRGPPWALTAFSLAAAGTVLSLAGLGKNSDITDADPLICAAVTAAFLLAWLVLPVRHRLCSSCGSAHVEAGFARYRCRDCGTPFGGEWTRWHGVLLDAARRPAGNRGPNHA